MTISEQAVKVFMDSFWGEASIFVEPSHVKASLTAAARYMQGEVREQALEEAARFVEGRDTGIDTDFIQKLSKRNLHEMAGLIAEHDFKLGAAIRSLASSNIENKAGAQGERVQEVEQLIRNALDELDNVTAITDQDANCIGCAENYLDRALAAIRALSSPDHADAGKVEGDGWQPIETAPKDRTSVIIAVPAKEKKDGFIVGEAYFDPENYEGGDWWWAGSSHTDHFDSPISDLNYNAPTHWRPLPSAPSEGAE